jgi:hypothetical protein
VLIFASFMTEANRAADQCATARLFSVEPAARVPLAGGHAARAAAVEHDSLRPRPRRLVLYYVFAVPATARLRHQYLFRFWTNDVIAPFFSAMLCCAAQVCVAAPTSPEERRLVYFFLAGAVGASWAGRMHFGGYKNAVIPTYAALAILFGIASARFLAGLRGGIVSGSLAAPPVTLFCLAQFVAFAVYKFPACRRHTTSRRGGSCKTPWAPSRATFSCRRRACSRRR